MIKINMSNRYAIMHLAALQLLYLSWIYSTVIHTREAWWSTADAQGKRVIVIFKLHR